jgi:hypothetical protein
MAKAGTSSKSPSRRKEVDYLKRKSILKRIHKIGIVLNDKELEAVEAYCKKNKIDSKSRFVRETVMRHVMDHFLNDYPTLFDKNDLDQLRV